MLELRTLGGLELRRTGEGTPGPIALQTKRLVLLAHLASAPSRAFRRRDPLLALFWPGLDEDHARGALRQALHSLRTALGEGVVLTRGESEIGIADSRIQQDAQRLEAALLAGKPAEALALYRGDFLEGVFVADASPELEEWIAGERERLRRLAARAAWAVAEGSPALEAGDAVRLAVRLSGDDEPALRRGIELLDRLGDHAGAIALYEEFARRVARDLEVEPSAETRKAIDRIRARTVPGRATAPPPGPGPVPDLGGAPPGKGRRPRRRVALAAALGVATLLILSLRAVRGPDRPGESDVVAIAPFRVSGADSSHAWMQEGMVDLLTIRLGGDGGIRVADPAAVIASWRRFTGDDPVTSPVESPRRIAADVGAEWVVAGSVVGTAGRVILSASLLNVASGRTVARGTAEGPTDSLPALVDRMAAQLMGGGAGLGEDRLASLTSSSYPAVRAFLAGRAAAQRGLREAAVPRFREALALDSTFALAALELMRAASWVGPGEDRVLGERLALAGRDRLGPSDRILLDALVTEFPGVPEMLRAWNAAVAAYPNRPDTWYGLGESYFHSGTAAGIPDAMTRAEAAFRQGWRLDSATSAAQGLGGALVAEPVEHMAQLAHMRRDTAEVGRLTDLVLAADSTGYLARTLEWHRAALGTPASRDAYWARIGRAPQRTLMLVSLFIGFTGEGVDDYPRVTEEDRRRLITHDPGFAQFAFTVSAMLRGRPGEVPRGPAPPEALASSPRRFWLQRALWWEGDTTGMGAVVRALEASAARAAVTPVEIRDRYLDLCALGLWHATRGDHAPARRAGAALAGVRLAGLDAPDSARSNRHLALCAALIEASAATGLAARDARAKLGTADSLARHVAFDLTLTPWVASSLPEANLLLARLWEAQGDLPRALEAVRRRGTIFIGAPVLMTSFLREEGRLAALTGDTAGAIRAYRHYLGLRYDPEPVLRPEVERVRRELARLERRQERE